MNNGIIKILLVMIITITLVPNVFAFDIAQVSGLVNDLQRAMDPEETEASSFDIGNLVSAVFCGCASTGSCEGVFATICIDLTDPTVIQNAGLNWAASILTNPVGSFCSVAFQGLASDLGISVDNSNLNSTFQRNANAYLEGARIFNEETLEYTYYFSFNFFPTESYNSNNIKFIAKKGAASVPLNTEVLPAAEQGFRHRYLLRTSEIYDQACMQFISDIPTGFSRNEICVKVAQI